MLDAQPCFRSTIMGLVPLSICVALVCAWRVVSSLEDIVTSEMTLPFLGGTSLTVPGWRPVKKGIGAGASREHVAS